MKKQLILIIFSVFIIASCGGDDLPEDYIVIDSKIVALKIDEPEVMEGDNISLKLLLAKNDFDQNSELPVQWTIGGDSDYQLISNYNENLEMTVPYDVLGDDSSVEVPVVATVTIGGKVLSAGKMFRITENPVGKNPVITGVEIDWLTDEGLQTETIAYGETRTFESLIKNFACTSLTEELPEEGNEKLVYRWYITRAVDSNIQIEINDTVDDIEALLGEGARAAEFRKSVVYSVFEKEGTYSVYLVVRDNKQNSTDSSMDRLGTDFFYFTIIIE